MSEDKTIKALESIDVSKAESEYIPKDIIEDIMRMHGRKILDFKAMMEKIDQVKFLPNLVLDLRVPERRGPIVEFTLNGVKCMIA